MITQKIRDIIVEVCDQKIPEKLANKAITRFRCDADKNDFIAEMYYLLVTMDNNRMLELYNQGTLPSYFAKICLNHLYSPSSIFFKKMEYNVPKTVLDAGRSIYLEFCAECISKYKNDEDE